MGDLTRDDVVYESPNGSVVSQDGFAGSLACDCGSRYKGCTHIWEAMKAGRDNIPLDSDTTVQLFPAPINGEILTFDVEIGSQDSRGLAPFRQSKTAWSSTEVIGFISPFEGRYQIARVTLEWLRSKYRTINACEEKRHSHFILSAKERRLLNADSSKPEVIAAIASYLQYGMCWDCFGGGSDDLIPDL